MPKFSSYAELGKAIKLKNPQVAGLDDEEVARNAISAKPELQSMVSDIPQPVAPSFRIPLALPRPQDRGSQEYADYRSQSKLFQPLQPVSQEKRLMSKIGKYPQAVADIVRTAGAASPLNYIPGIKNVQQSLTEAVAKGAEALTGSATKVVKGGYNLAKAADPFSDTAYEDRKNALKTAIGQTTSGAVGFIPQVAAITPALSVASDVVEPITKYAGVPRIEEIAGSAYGNVKGAVTKTYNETLGIDPNSKEGAANTEMVGGFFDFLAAKGLLKTKDGISGGGKGPTPTGVVPVEPSGFLPGLDLLRLKAPTAMSKIKEFGQQQVLQPLKQGAQKAGEVGAKIGQEGIASASKISLPTLKQIVADEPMFAKVKEKGSAELAKTDLFDRFKQALEERQSERSSTSRQYKSIRESATAVPMGDYWQGLQKKYGIEERVNSRGDVELSLNSESPLNAADLAKIAEWKAQYGQGEITPNAFLNFRDKLAVRAGFGRDISTQLENFAKDARKTLNEKVRPQIPGLQNLDAKLAPQIKFLKRIEPEIFFKTGPKAGEVKPGAINTALRLAGENAKLFEELLPGISREAKAIKALADVEYARNGRTVGAYFGDILRGGAVIGGVSGGVAGLPLAVGAILTSPSVLVPLLQKYAQMKVKMSKGEVGGITGKIKNGIKLKISEAKKVSNFLQQLKPNEVEEIAKNVQSFAAKENIIQKGKNDYIYHTTSIKNLESIRGKGLLPSRGQFGKGVYFAPSIAETGGYGSPEGMLLRTKKSNLKKFDDLGDQIYVEKNVEPYLLDFSIDNGKHWKKLQQ